jgi:aminoglycoside phosphotransferase
METSLPPAVVSSLARQLRALHTKPPEGVTFLPSESGSLTELYASIEGPGARLRTHAWEPAAWPFRAQLQR